MDVDRTTHTSVLLAEVLAWLDPRGGIGFVAVDCTVGAGGHASALLDRSSPDGRLIGLDADPHALELARERLARFEGRVRLIHANFGQLAELELEPMNAVLFDLGLSSMQLDVSGRGFSFRGDEPLDMRFDPTSSGPTAADVVNTYPENELERILREYGDERRARQIARALVRRRPITRTQQLTELFGPAHGRIHPATRTFQALRIAVNDELGALETGLDATLGILKPGGRAAVISFHSLEDRIVKWRFRRWADEGRARVLTRKPVVPQADETQANARARSAKLRVMEKIA